MATSYANEETLRRAYATEPQRVASGWTYMTCDQRPDGSTVYTVQLRGGGTETWRRAAGVQQFVQV